MDTPPESPVAALAKALAGSNDTGKVAFGTEGGLFQQSGIPTVVCGPGSIAQAHKPNEFVSLDQLSRCERFMERLLGHLSL
jgi:acetylornithine deacetylase